MKDRLLYVSSAYKKYLKYNMYEFMKHVGYLEGLTHSQRFRLWVSCKISDFKKKYFKSNIDKILDKYIVRK